MEQSRLEELSAWFEAYAMSFADADGRLPKAAECKLVHTREVRKAAARVATAREGAELSGPLAVLAEAGGLLHDVARFEQYKQFKTFSDRKSFDHGEYGAGIIREKGLCAGLPEAEAQMLLQAVALHNKIALPEGLPKDAASIAKVVRDADKIGILQFISRYLNEEADYWRDPAISFEMPDTPDFTPSIAAAVLEGKLVPHKDIRCVNDFLISLFAWPMDLNYAESARTLLEHALYFQIGKHLPPSPLLDEMMDASSVRLLMRAGMDN